MEKLWRFTDNFGSFKSQDANQLKTLYFPLCNEAIMSCVSPDLHGDSKTGQNAFLLEPVSRINLVNLRASRNFWIYARGRTWSATGVSKDSKQIAEDRFGLKAGLLWQEITRENKKIGLRAEILSFVPAGKAPVEIMQVKLSNISAKKIKFTPTAAIPIFGRSAENLRDHRHVTSLLQRLILHKYGVIARPTLSFAEAGHRPNQTCYFVLGWDEKAVPPQYLYPTQEMFCGEAGDLEAPQSVLYNLLPANQLIQGKEAMGAIRFRELTLAPGQAKFYTILLGITEAHAQVNKIIPKFNSPKKVAARLGETKKFWAAIPQKISLASGDADFDCWFCWVAIQPVLRKIFGCSFLPDFDYGKGGRGWRDLWQDCLALILDDPQKVRRLLINNFAGVRIDGSNATIITTQPLRAGAGFISDRNNISRVWMDHGVWPLLTLDLYLQESGDFKILEEEVAYFRDHQLCRSQEKDFHWSPEFGYQLKTSSGKIYSGSVLEHLLVQHLVQFFNVGLHNYSRLEGADWNDGLDMAKDRGESVAFSALYAQNLATLAELLLKIGKKRIKIARELKILLRRLNYHDVKAKQALLATYFSKTKFSLSGKKIEVESSWLAADLKEKSAWLKRHIRQKQWLKEGFFNGYYDNQARRLEGRKGNLVRMCLTSQVFPVLSGVATDRQVRQILNSVNKYLKDKRLQGLHLNSDFKSQQHDLGRAFCFVYGDKENGAFFNHMAVLFSYGLYQRGFVKEGWEILSSIYQMATSPTAKIYPCLPEYFDAQGRGMYSYLTGSASWFVLTMITQAFGIKGKDGELCIEPKLSAWQFRNSRSLSLKRIFAGRKLTVKLQNLRRLDYGQYRIAQASLNGQQLLLRPVTALVIPRRSFLRLANRGENQLKIILD
jgi:cellobiose phosphorylase